VSKKRRPAGIQSIQRAAAILRSFTKTESELGVTTLSQQLGLHKSTVSRLLSTLEQEGFVEQNPETGKYRLGMALVTLAGIVLERLDLREAARPYLDALAERTQETVNIVVLSENECMNIGGAASPRPIQYIGRMGRRTPLHCTSAGKVLLAFLPPNEWRGLLPDPLPRYTARTIVDREQLAPVLEQIRQQGYAITHEEHQEGLSAVAAPIHNHTGQVVAAVVVSGPTYRIGPAEVETFVTLVRKTAQAISTHLGNGAAGGSLI
jgi:DNA-binding IclR family transcriptional regulator